MGIVSYINSQAQRFVYTGKFCLPKPLTLTGTFSTSPNTFSIDSLAIDPLNTKKVIATVAAGHNLNAFSEKPIFITISGASQPEYNGYVKATVINLTTFSYWFAGSVTDPATGTIIADLGGCTATGVGTLAKSELKPGDWLYVPDLDAIRQISSIESNILWHFFDNFPSNVSSGTPVQKSDAGLYNGISVANSGSADGIYQEQDLAYTSAYVTSSDPNGLAPVCGDATGTTFEVAVERRTGI